MTFDITASMPPPVSTCLGISFATTRKKPCSSLNSSARPRSRPSTSTFTLPPGSLRLWTMLQMVPRVWISSGPGLSRVASCWAERKMRLPFTSAYSRALMELGRPITNGIIMCGNTTTSRSGTIGRVSITSVLSFSFPNIPQAHRSRHQCDTTRSPEGRAALTDLLDEGDGLLAVEHDLPGHHALLHLLHRGQVVHQVEHQVLDDHPQAARPDLPDDGEVGDGLQRVVREAQLDVLVVEHPLVLPDDRVLGLGQDLDEGGLVEVVEGADDGQPAHELGDQPVLDEVRGLDLAEGGGGLRGRRLGGGLRAEAQALLAHPALDDLVQPDERPAADEQDVGGVDLVELLVGVLAAALGGHVGHRPFQDLEEGLLDPLARDVAGDGGVLVLARDLVDLVYIDDALLALLDVPARRLEQLQDDVLHVLSDVAGLGEGGGVHDREGDGEESGQGLGEQRLARPRRPDQEDVGLGELDLVLAPLLRDLDALVVVVNGDGQLLLGGVLADDVLVEELLDLVGNGEGRLVGAALDPAVVRDDVVADIHALVADEDGGAGNELPDVVLIFIAERTAENLGFPVFLHSTR